MTGRSLRSLRGMFDEIDDDDAACGFHYKLEDQMLGLADHLSPVDMIETA